MIDRRKFCFLGFGILASGAIDRTIWIPKLESIDLSDVIFDLIDPICLPDFPHHPISFTIRWPKFNECGVNLG